MLMVVRTARLEIRVSETELAEIRRRAAAMSLDVSEYARVRLLGGAASQPVDAPKPAPKPRSTAERIAQSVPGVTLARDLPAYRRQGKPGELLKKPAK